VTIPQNPVTQLLAAVTVGEAGAQERLWSLIYQELRTLAERQMAGESPGNTLQPTALVHEAYFRLFGENPVQWNSRGHFFMAAAEAMRRIRVDGARKRGRLKRGGDKNIGSLAEDPPSFGQDPAEVLAVGEALDELARTAPRHAEVVKLRYFTGLTVDECAAVLGVSPRTVDKDWAFARAWLHRKLGDSDGSVEAAGEDGS
jgi:RNA polymerase sigma factor (TIGR02999 family)